ncbi:hypothetical protein KKG71_03015 [Patescibacteria group bacterium]|nr:hypothetical protein [Patescibacteria group bacterium]
MKLTKTTQIEKSYKDFPITNVCRADLEQVGFNSTNVDDDTMSVLASKMANAYCEFGFWEDLKILAVDSGIKKRKKPEKQNHIGCFIKKN